MVYSKERNCVRVALVIIIVVGVMVSCATPSNRAAEESIGLDISTFAKPGFVVLEEDGRLWVFREGSTDLAKFQEVGEPAKQVVRPKAGPDGVTLKSSASATIDEYLTTLPGFFTQMEDGRLWVFRSESPELGEFLRTGKTAKQVVRPLSGPFGLTLKSVETQVIDEYLLAWGEAETQ